MLTPTSTNSRSSRTEVRDNGQPLGRPHSAWQSGALQAIFALFLGVIVALVVGVGVNTFHPNPADETRVELEQLYQRQQVALIDKEVPAPATDEEQQVQARILELEAVAREQEQRWASTSSIVVIALATFLLAAAVILARVASAWVFSTGLLLGGIFTMLYGVGLSVMSEQSVLRFVLLLVALGITSSLGYLRFVRMPRHPSLPRSEGSALPDEMDRRLTRVETSLDSLRHALRDV